MLLSEDEWSHLVIELLKAGRGGSAAEIVQMHQEQFGGTPYINTIISEWLQNPEQMSQLVNKNNLLDIAHILTIDPQLTSMTADISSASWTQLLKVLSDKFAREARDLSPARFESLVTALDRLAIVPARAHHAPDFATQLLWYEGLLRSLEDALRANPESSIQLNRVTSTAPGLWMQLRLRGSLDESAREKLARLLSATPVGQALLWKLRLQSTEADLSARASAKNFCEWLEQNGLETRRPAKLEWADLARPGCVELAPPPAPEATLAFDVDGPARMAFDSLLFTSGWNMRLHAQTIDGSFIDLSTQLTHPDLAIEPEPADDDAVTVPLLLGLRIHDPTFLRGPGTYYFVYHYTWRAVDMGAKTLSLLRHHKWSQHGLSQANREILRRGLRSLSLKLTEFSRSKPEYTDYSQVAELVRGWANRL